jgi:hypothetical protein
MSHHLVGEYRLCIDPVVLGNGKRLFRGNAVAASLKLLDGRITSTGITLSTYAPAGRPAYGEFAMDQLGKRVRDDVAEIVPAASHISRVNAQ